MSGGPEHQGRLLAAGPGAIIRKADGLSELLP